MAVEAYMFTFVGLFLGLLVTIVSVALVHERSNRLALVRQTETMPALARELRANGDLLRAQFAVTVRQLEIKIETLRDLSTATSAELGRKKQEVQRLRACLNEHAARTIAAEALNASLRQRLYSIATV